LEALAARLGLNEHVQFLGDVDRNDIPGFFAAADVLAVSSVYEGTSLVTVEAAAAGKPVVTTDVAGAADTVIDGETGFVVPLTDPAALAAALLRVLADPGRAAEMGAAAREHAQARFGLTPAINRVIEMWRATAARPAS
jgi:glycosyltransferase involved in cell wall biosynthesis